ncbi:MAG: TfoX/Sxy family protein [Methanomicrobia archaeon]|nr:TfoX/Sxy family protein [Methanomicrobia archaeon]
MAWKKAPDELIRFLAEQLRAVDCVSRTMFGYPVYFINGNMFIGAYQDDLFLRLAAQDREQAQAKYTEIRPFEPMPGRIMREYVILPRSVYKEQAIFTDLLTRSIRYVTSLPPKEKHRGKTQ